MSMFCLDPIGSPTYLAWVFQASELLNLCHLGFDYVNASRVHRHMCNNITGICQEKPSAEIQGELSKLISRWVLRGVLVDFGGPLALEKIHPNLKIHSNIQVRIWELHSQNPHCKDLPLIFVGWAVSPTDLPVAIWAVNFPISVMVFSVSNKVILVLVFGSLLCAEVDWASCMMG